MHTWLVINVIDILIIVLTLIGDTWSCWHLETGYNIISHRGIRYLSDGYQPLILNNLTWRRDKPLKHSCGLAAGCECCWTRRSMTFHMFSIMERCLARMQITETRSRKNSDRTVAANFPLTFTSDTTTLSPPHGTETGRINQQFFVLFGCKHAMFFAKQTVPFPWAKTTLCQSYYSHMRTVRAHLTLRRSFCALNKCLVWVWLSPANQPIT